jgi:hypothetical protein
MAFAVEFTAFWMPSKVGLSTMFGTLSSTSTLKKGLSMLKMHVVALLPRRRFMAAKLHCVAPRMACRQIK